MIRVVGRYTYQWSRLKWLICFSAYFELIWMSRMTFRDCWLIDCRISLWKTSIISGTIIARTNPKTTFERTLNSASESSPHIWHKVKDLASRGHRNEKKRFWAKTLTLAPLGSGTRPVTRPAGGGGPKGPPEISQTTGPISKFQTAFDSPVRDLPVQGKKVEPEVTDDVTGQVKVRIFDFSGLVTSASKISSMLSANKANESARIVSLTSVNIISCALWP